MKKNLLLTLGIALASAFGMMSYAQNLFLVQQPSNLAGSYTFTDSFTADGWGADLNDTAITAEAAWALDGSAADSIVCEAVVNGVDVSGKIAFLYRGSCNFSLKAYNAQAAGAVACVIVNNVPGNLINMSGGDSATAVTIPVIFISDADGALLRDAIIAGGSEMFIGNPNGVFTNNIGAYNGDFSMANSQSIPASFVEAGSGFEVPIGAWVFNYGSADAENVIVSASIDRDGAEVYNETSAGGASILPGDSLFVSLTSYSDNGYEAGFYTITYNIIFDASDELPTDNELITSSWINNEGIYSKSRVDPTTGPVGATGLRPASSTEFQWCVAMQSNNAESMQITGMTFNTLTNDIDLTGEAVQLSVYEWNDPFDGTAAPTFDDLNELTDNELYDYPSDLQGEFVSHTFSEPLELLNDQKYLACATIFIDDMFLGVDAGLDYNVTYDSYPTEIFFPLNDIDGGTWYSGGFGTDNVPALIVDLELVNGIAEDVNRREVTPFPNPTIDMINIPFGAALDGTVLLDIVNVNGQSVRSEELCLKNAHQLSVDVTELSAGMYSFSLLFEDNSKTSFKVMVSK